MVWVIASSKSSTASSLYHHGCKTAAPTHLQRQAEVLHHAAHDHALQRVLLAKVRAIRLDDVEELGDDCRNAAEEAGPRRALRQLGYTYWVHKGHMTRPVHGGTCRREDQIHEALRVKQSHVLGHGGQREEASFEGANGEATSAQGARWS